MDAVIEEVSLTEVSDSGNRYPATAKLNNFNKGFRPWQEVNEDVSSRMIAASSDSPPIIPKRDYDDSLPATPEAPRHHLPSERPPDNIAEYTDEQFGQLVLYQGPIEPPYGDSCQMMPPPMMYPGVMHPDFPPPFGPPPPPMFYDDPMGGFGPFPMGPMIPPPEFFDDDRLYRKKNKKNKKIKKWRSLEMMGPPPPFPGPVPFPGCPMGPPMGPEFCCPGPPHPAPQSRDGPDTSMALVPVGSMGPPAGQMMPVPMPMPPMYEPLPMPMMPHPVPVNGLIPATDKPLSNGKATAQANGTLPTKKPTEDAGKPVKKRGTCYLICCRGHTQVLWIIIGIILIGVILGLVLGLTLVG